MANSLTLYTDGASEGNPGPAGAAYVLLDESGTEVERGSRPLGRTTNNVAEYQGLLMGLRAARDLQAKSLRVRMDSELVVRQMEGVYKVKHPDLRPLYDEATALSQSFSRIRFEHVPRERNRLADELASGACRSNSSPASDRASRGQERVPSSVAVTQLGRIEKQAHNVVELSLHEPGVSRFIRIEQRQGGGLESVIDIPADKLSELLDALELGWAYLHNANDSSSPARGGNGSVGRKRRT